MQTFELFLAFNAAEFFKPQKANPSLYLIPLFKALESFQNHQTITSNSIFFIQLENRKFTA
jgi:hypothetical protein